MAGGTRHDIVFPNFPLATPPIGDVTGGLLSDLAFDSNEIRRAESELKFLSKAMRKGLYPHRGDAFFVRVRIVPKESINTDVLVETTITSDDKTLAESVILVDQHVAKNTYAVEKARLAVAPNVIDTSALQEAVVMEETMSLPVPRGEETQIRIHVEFRQRDTNTTNPALAKHFETIAVSVERENESYADVLHHVEVGRPDRKHRRSI